MDFSRIQCAYAVRLRQGTQWWRYGWLMGSGISVVRTLYCYQSLDCFACGQSNVTTTTTTTPAPPLCDASLRSLNPSHYSHVQQRPGP